LGCGIRSPPAQTKRRSSLAAVTSDAASTL
jgi:hypothetical protein